MAGSRKTKIAFAALVTLCVLLYIQAFIFPILTYVLFVWYEYSAPVGPLDYAIYNRDNATHAVYIEISRAEIGELIYRANHTLGPGEWTRSKPITDEPGRYRVKAIVDGKIEDERCICIQKFTGGAIVEVRRIDGNVTVYITQGAA